MKKRTVGIIITVIIVLVLAWTAVSLYRGSQLTFRGSRVKNPDAYLLDIEKMNGTDLHTLELRKGDVLQIRFETVKGSLNMEIKAPDGTPVYRGNGKGALDFTVNIPEDGAYTIVVEARQAQGIIHIRCKEKL